MLSEREQNTLVWKKIQDIKLGYFASIALSTAVELGLFTYLSENQKTVQEVAQELGYSSKVLEKLLNVLVKLELIVLDDSKYSVAPGVDVFLSSKSKFYRGGAIAYDQSLWDCWRHLPEIIRTGKPIAKKNSVDEGEEFFPELASALFPEGFILSSGVAALLKKRGYKFTKILDVAAGSAAWSLGFAVNFPEVKVTVQDFPSILELSRSFVEKHEMQDRYDYLPGDLVEVDFGQERFDLIILGNICHYEGERKSRQLIERCARALVSGGVLLIVEIPILDEDRKGPLSAICFSVSMMLITEEGDNFTASDYKQWALDAGFKKAGKVETSPNYFPIILAVK